MKGLYFGAVLTLTLLPASAEIYKWLGPDGSISFSDERPENHNFETLKEKSAPVIKALPPSSSEPEQTPQDSIPNTAPRKAMSNTAISFDAKRCAALMMELETLGRTEAVYRDEEGMFHTHKSPFSRFYNGERSYLNDDTREQATKLLRDESRQWCKEDSQHQRLTSQALAELEKQRECQLVRRHLDNLRAPRLRTADSDLRDVEIYLRESCQMNQE